MKPNTFIIKGISIQTDKDAHQSAFFRSYCGSNMSCFTSIKYFKRNTITIENFDVTLECKDNNNLSNIFWHEYRCIVCLIFIYDDDIYGRW